MITDLKELLEKIDQKYKDDKRGYPYLHIFTDGSGFLASGNCVFFSFGSVQELVEKLEEE